MAIGKNQYGTYETDKPIGSKRFPVTSEQEKLAQLAYGKNFSELTTDQRTKIRAGKLIKDKITFEQYLEDYKGMANDRNYKPKYIKSGVGVGISPQQKRALAEAKKNIENFDVKYQKNVNKRKKLKRAENPENVKKDLASRAERRVNRRLKEKDVALSPREKNINLEQRKLVKEYNAPIRKNPNMVLGNKALMEKLSITVSKDGDIIKIPTGLTEKYLKDRGLFEIDHQRDIYKKGKGKNLPYNRNLIMGPYNRNGGFKDMAEKFIAANPNSPKIEAILKQAEDLKVTLQPEVPTGTFKTKGIGYKQASDPIEKFKSAFNSLQSKLISSANKLSKPETLKFCSLLSNGGLPGDCKQALKADPEKAAKILSEAPVTSAAMKDVKGNAQKMIRLFRGEPFKSRTAETVNRYAEHFNMPKKEVSKRILQGQFFSANPDMASSYTDKLGKMKYVDVTPKEFQDMKRYVERINKTKDVGGKVRFPVSRTNDGNNIQIVPRRKLKQFEETGRMKSKRTIFGNVEVPKGTLRYDSVVGGFVDPQFPTQVVNNAQIKAWATENPMPVKAGTEDALKPIKGNLLKTVGRSLAKVGAPLPTALIDGYFVGKQILEDRPAAEIAKDPLNWLGLATMSTLSNISGVSKPGKINTALRLGMSPGLIRGVSRFAGIPGLAISTALTAYDQYQKYQNQEGLIYDFFNKVEERI